MLYTEAEIRELLARDEGQFHDFKSVWDRTTDQPRLLDRRMVRDWIAEYAAAFANADGGTLIIGVENDGTPSGHEYHDEAIEEFRNVPERRLRPAVACRFQRLLSTGGKCWSFRCP